MPTTNSGKLRLLGLSLACAAMMTTGSHASVIFTGSSGSLAASAMFDIVGGNLQVTLTNTSASDVLVPADVLTAVFFSVAGNPALSSTSAALTGGSSVLFGGTDAGGVVGGEWGFGNSLVGAPGGVNSGISSSGFGVFGNATFPGTNLQGPAALDGLQYGITSAGDNAATGNAAVTGGNALIKNSVLFTLGNLPSGFLLSDIGSVSFQYGTALTEPNFGGNCTSGCVPPPPRINAPEPMTIAILGVGYAGLGFLSRRRKR